MSSDISSDFSSTEPCVSLSAMDRKGHEKAAPVQTEFEALIDTAFAILSGKANDTAKEALDLARQKLLDLSIQEVWAVRGALWLEMKDKTLAEFTDRAAKWLADPASLAATLDLHIDEVATMPDQKVKALAGTYPEALAEIMNAVVGILKVQAKSR